MAKKLILLAFCLLLGSVTPLKAQTTPYLTLDLGYEYYNRSFGSAGVSLYLVQLNENVWNFSGRALMGGANDTFLLIPEAEIGYTISGKNNRPYKDIRASFYKIGLAATPYSIKPRLGINIGNIWEIYGGYAWEFNPKENISMQGIFIGTTFHLPTQLF